MLLARTVRELKALAYSMMDVADASQTIVANSTTRSVHVHPRDQVVWARGSRNVDVLLVEK